MQEQSPAKTKSALKRILRRQALYRATGFFFILYLISMLIYAATLPDTFRIERSIRINAPTAKIFSYINDFHQWQDWSPWEKIDPALERHYSGSDKDIGAVYTWQGNKDVGAGRMEIITSIANSSVKIKLDFTQPFEAHNTVAFTLVKQDDATRVTQTLYGSRTYFSKLLGLAFDMDKMVGDKYTEGLRTLKAVTEQVMPPSTITIN